MARFLPYWHEEIVPDLRAGKRVLIAAHGNSLRDLVKYLDGVSDEEITGLNISTGVPFVYELDEDLKPSATTASATPRPSPPRPGPSRTRARRSSSAIGL